MSGYSLRSGACCFPVVRLYVVLMVCAICAKCSRAASGGNGSLLPKPGGKPLGKNSSGARQLPPSEKPSSSTPKKRHLPAIESSLPAQLPSLLKGRKIPMPQARPQADGGKLVKERGAEFEGRLGKYTQSPSPSGGVRRVKGERTVTDRNGDVDVEAGRVETRAFELKRLFEQGVDPSLRGSSGLPSKNLKENVKPALKNTSIADKRTKTLEKMALPANADQATPVLESQPDIHKPEKRHHQAVPKVLKPPLSSSFRSSSSEAQNPVYENLRSGVSNAFDNSASYDPVVSRACEEGTQGATNIYVNSPIGASGAHKKCRTGASNADEDCKNEPIYDEINDLSREAVEAFQRPEQPSHKSSRTTGRLLIRRGVTSLCQVSRGRGESNSGWSVRTLFNVLSYSYIPLALPLLIAGLLNEDQLLLIAGIVLLGGGSVLNILSLLALWLRGVSPSNIVPMTARNFDLIFDIPNILSVSMFTIFNYHISTFLSAVVSAGRVDWLRTVAPFCAFSYLLYLAVLVHSLYESARQLRQRSAADPELGVSNDLEDEGETFPAFEMVYTPTSAARNGHTESDESSSSAQRHPRLSRLLDYLRLNLYQPFITAMGIALIGAICLTRHLHPPTERTRGTPATPTPPVQPSYLPHYLNLLQLLPSFSHGETPMSAASPSLLAIGSMGALYLLLAIGSALLRWITSCARCITRSQPCWRRSNRGPRVALTYYPFGLGISAAAIGFLAAYMEVQGSPGPSFTRIIELGTAVFGIIMALFPTLWTTLQSIGVSLSRVLIHCYQIELSRQRRGGSSRGHDTGNEQTSPPEQSQLPAEGQTSRYSVTEPPADNDSFTEWDSDE